MAGGSSTKSKFIRQRKAQLKRLEALLTLGQTALSDPTKQNNFLLGYEDLENQKRSFETIHYEIVALLEDEEEDGDILETFDSIVYSIKSIYRQLRPIDAPTQVVNLDATLNQTCCSGKKRLRHPDVPKFNGELRQWPVFFELYNALIHNCTDYMVIEKMQFLATLLEGEAKSLLNNFPLVEANYHPLYKALVERYQNNRQLLSTYWNSIFYASNVKNESLDDLRSLLTTFSENIAALERMGHRDMWDYTKFFLLSWKLTPPMLERFEMWYSEKKGNVVPAYDDLKSFLDKNCRALENSIFFNVSVPGPSFRNDAAKRVTNISRKPRAMITKAEPSRTSNKTTLSVCPCCKVQDDSHTLILCDKFLQMEVKDRHALVKKERLCFNCLLKSHGHGRCPDNRCCSICEKRHSTALHFPTEHDHERSTSVKTCYTKSNQPSILFATARVRVRDAAGNMIMCRAVLDSASEASFISSDCVNRLSLNITPAMIPVQGIDNMSSHSSLGTVNFTILPLCKDDPSFNLKAIVMPSICGLTPSMKVDSSSWRYLDAINLADPGFGDPKEADILLSADIFSQVMCEGFQPGQNGGPCAINTVFGYVLLGGANVSKGKVLTCCTSFAPLNETLKSFWELENVPQKSPLTIEEVNCEQFFVDTHTRDVNGRYCVRLPFKKSPSLLGNSYSQALKRFKLLELRLLRNVKLHSSYVDFMRDYLEQGHMSLNNLPNPNEGYFIPHFCVVKNDSDSIRVVFDAACPTSDSSPSLNELLYIGPKLQNDIVSILFSIRFYSVIFLADIRQMYRQILVDERDVMFQKILWRFDPLDPIREYCLKTVTYGVSTSPYLALRCLLQLVEDHGQDYPLACDILKHQTYIDDCVGLAVSVEQGLEMQKQLISLLQKGCFELRKWASNRPELLELVPESHQQPIIFSDKECPNLKVLGLQWNPSSDVFSYSVKPIDRVCTKRNILSEIARLYDPLGFVTPVVLVAKLLIQQLWRDGISWDERPSEEIVKKWQSYLEQLPVLSSLAIPRYVVKSDAVVTQIHGFSDASTSAMGACVYLKQIDKDGNVYVSLLCAKSKVAPLKAVSLPRLELLAACLLTDLMCFVVDSLRNVKVDKVYAWSDSTITLYWIRSSPHRWKCFVANRVSHIQEKLSPDCWHFVNGNLNPSDCSSRGVLAQELLAHPLWWTGPPWLHTCDINSDFDCSGLEMSEVVMCEQKKTVFFSKLLSHPFLDLLHRYSSFRKILRLVAMCLRFIANCKLSENLRNVDTCFTQLELYQALIVLVKFVQQVEFCEELTRLKKGQLCSKPLRKLCCFLDKDGVIRVGGRLRHAAISFDYKHPILLPRSHRLTEIIIECFHRENCHPGPRTLQYLLMQQFWILSARRAIHHVLSKCIPCFRTKPIPLSPMMSNLPFARVTPAKAFKHSGVDFAGPIKMTLGKRRGVLAQKAYICVFICLPTRALHLEVVSDMSTPACLAALRRFVGRRGTCSDIWSDQGSNFHGVNNLLTKYCKQAADSLGIKWHFNPPASPHFGGSWEAGVKSVKTHLRRVIGEQILTYEEWHTVLIQIESCLNSRPLCNASPDPNELRSLCPGDFLYLEPTTAPPDEDLVDINPSRLTRWQLVQQIHQHFWKRWHLEYLNSLQQREKWNVGCDIPKVGALVVLKEENTPPLKWNLGRILKLYPGSDGIVRVAKVKVANGELDRPLVKICPLPDQ